MVGGVNKNEGEEVNRGAGRGARGRARRARFWRCLRDFSELDLREVRYLRETVAVTVFCQKGKPLKNGRAVNSPHCTRTKYT